MIRYITTAALLLFVMTSQAQPSGGPSPAPNGVPIDGGASLLLAGGAAYVVRKIQQRRKK